MKKIFALMAAAMVVVSINASTPYKNLYVTAEVAPSGAGSVYLSVKPGEEAYVRSQSEDFGETASIQATIGENGTEPCTYSCNSQNGVYEVVVNVETAPGYEVVCLANKINENGIYYAGDCYARFDSYDSGSRNANFDYSNPDLGYIINCNNVVTHNYEDGNSSSGPSRDVCFADDSKWGETPDAQVYVIMRKTGETLPKLDLSEKPEYENNTTNMETKENGLYSNVIFCQPGSTIELPVCMKNTTTEVAGLQFTMAASGVQFDTDAFYNFSERVSALDCNAMVVYADTMKVAAFSENADTAAGQDGDIMVALVKIPEGTASGNYDFKFTNVVLATAGGKAVTCDETTVSIIVGYDVPDAIEALPAATDAGQIFTVTGVKVAKAVAPGIYIQSGKKFIVR